MYHGTNSFAKENYCGQPLALVNISTFLEVTISAA